MSEDSLPASTNLLAIGSGFGGYAALRAGLFELDIVLVDDDALGETV